MINKNYYGIKEALLASAVLAGVSSVEASVKTRLTSPEIEKMQELGMTAQEFQFLKEYTELVNKYPELKGTFGLARTHQHFRIGPDEVLHETTEFNSRVSTTQVVPKESLPSNAIPAVFDDGGGNVFKVQPRTWCCD